MSSDDFNVRGMLNFLAKARRAVGKARRQSRNLQRRLEDYEDIEESLIELITKKFEVQCEIHFYGSRAIGIGNYRSDIDIYVELNDDYYRGTDVNFQRQIMQYISGAFRKWHPDFNLQKVPLYNATVPLIFCFYLPKRLRAELTFNDGLGVENSLLLQHLFNIQPEAVNLFHFLRIWLSIANMRFKNYQTLLLVVFFLQTKQCMPSIGHVQQGLKTKRIKDWKVQFNAKRTLSSYDCQEMGYFLHEAIDFFNFYADFNFARKVIIPHLGKAVWRENYARNVSRLPGNPELFKIDKPMAVTSLLTTDYNVTYNIGADRVRKFQSLCQYSEGLIENNM